jgi:hypothetical protein
MSNQLGRLTSLFLLFAFSVSVCAAVEDIGLTLDVLTGGIAAAEKS